MARVLLWTLPCSQHRTDMSKAHSGGDILDVGAGESSAMTLGALGPAQAGCRRTGTPAWAPIVTSGTSAVYHETWSCTQARKEAERVPSGPGRNGYQPGHMPTLGSPPGRILTDNNVYYVLYVPVLFGHCLRQLRVTHGYELEV